MLCEGTVGILKKHDELEFNNASILYTMERFIKTVHEMEGTILFPSRLLDLTVDNLEDRFDLEDKCNSIIRTSLTNSNLYHLYKIISQMKVDLICSHKSNNFNKPMESTVSEQKFKCARSYSSTSMQSVHSAGTFSDSESDIVTENDSGVENEDNLNTIGKVFKRHLHDLHCTIQKLTLIAEYITSRYQIDINNQT
ncbi:unnamed protein product [Xylocopa violacea]|uniref:Uncharacterized protein n=1 Tax=Xylocopa violacea TaxID=135666 RepID=A0ABP1MWV2_XYLVO